MQLIYRCLGLILCCLRVSAMEHESYTSRIQELQRTLNISHNNPAHTAILATRPIAGVIPLGDIPEQTHDYHLKSLIEIIERHGWEIITPRLQEQIVKNGWQDHIARHVSHAMPIKTDEPKKRPLPLIVCASVVIAAMAGYDVAQAYQSITIQEWEKQQRWHQKLALVFSRTYLTKFLNRLR